MCRPTVLCEMGVQQVFHLAKALVRVRQCGDLPKFDPDKARKVPSFRHIQITLSTLIRQVLPWKQSVSAIACIRRDAAEATRNSKAIFSPLG